MSIGDQSRTAKPVRFEDELLDRHYVAKWVGLSYDRFGALERRGEGPPAIYITRKARKYFRRDVRKWLEERRSAPLASPAPASRRRGGRLRGQEATP